ncbi:MAG: Ku protein [Acidobacteriaceae bacterium]|nr:Ku protein [Acidobacteriaceae bacterium]MBV9295054.1 Ku protein [Acidobacteriaceae bacterium]MBV9767015.1 Ku protein [Acidobacteriaceae bacterium]
MASTVWRGYITFGLISIPVRLFRAARPERVNLRRVYRAEAPEAPEPLISRSARVETTAATRFDATRRAESSPEPVINRVSSLRPEPILSPVKQVSVRKGSEEVLPERSVVKGYEYEKNRFVVVEPEELKSITPQTSAGMEIQEFVELAEIDPVYFETSYYVRPEEAGEKAYALLYRSMQTTGLVALAQFAMHSREHVVVLRSGKSGMLAHTMFFTSEVRAEEEYRADPSLVKEKELDLAQTLIRSLAAPFDPEKYRDTYRERLESMLAKKVQGQPVTITEMPQKPAEVVDIAEALRKSLANLKKPAASQSQKTDQTGAAVPSKKLTRGAGRK